MTHQLQRASCRTCGSIGGLLLVLATLTPAAVRAELEVSLRPAASVVAPGDPFEVEVVVTAGGDGFNGFDLEIGFDPSRLALLDQETANQPGHLMLEACSQNPFHLFTVATDSTNLDVTLVLMCAGASVSEPGVVYNLLFASKHRTGPAELRFLPGTRFLDAGVRVEPLLTVDGSVEINSVPPVVDIPSPANNNLRATPNPFNPRTVLSFTVPQAGPVKLTVYGINGRRLTTLVDQPLTAGEHQVAWNGTDARGLLLPSSSYRICLESRGIRTVQAVTLLK
jgi:hypothetical protein